nr:unnamed protein product [Spirometra erinaceieuropaei]
MYRKLVLAAVHLMALGTLSCIPTTGIISTDSDICIVPTKISSPLNAEDLLSKVINNDHPFPAGRALNCTAKITKLNFGKGSTCRTEISQISFSALTCYLDVKLISGSFKCEDNGKLVTGGDPTERNLTAIVKLERDKTNLLTLKNATLGWLIQGHNGTQGSKENSEGLFEKNRPFSYIFSKLVLFQCQLLTVREAKIAEAQKGLYARRQTK